MFNPKNANKNLKDMTTLVYSGPELKISGTYKDSIIKKGEGIKII